MVREVARELGWKEGKDFVEKLIDGGNLKPGISKLEGEKYHLVSSPEDINPESTPAAIVGDFVIEALTYQIASTPSIVINEEAAFIGTIPTKEELLEAIGRV
ncbi:MAG: thioredoxin family protein [archaeon]|nr:MAG: thioredoxin family protein [archaeon]